MIDLVPMDPARCPNWNARLDGVPCSSFFATSNWAEVLEASYGFKPHYFVSESDDHKPCTVVPIMEIRSLITGRRGVSLPFSDCCSSMLYGGHNARDIVDFLIDYGRKAKWKYLELRAVSDLCQDWPVYSQFYGHLLDLTGGPDALYSRLKRTIRQNIRKSIEAGVTVDRDDSRESTKQYYRLQCITRRRHGLPPQPWRFFKNLHSYVLSKNLGCVMLARLDRRAIAGGVFLHCGGTVMYKYAASDMRYQHLRPSELLTWKGIESYCNTGYSQLCFGRTELGQDGLRRYKRGWGTSEENIRYYRYSYRHQRFVERGDENMPCFPLLRRLPMPLVRCLGSVVYKHIA